MKLERLVQWLALLPIYATLSAIVVHYGYFLAFDPKLLSYFTIVDATDNLGRFALDILFVAAFFWTIWIFSIAIFRWRAGASRAKRGLPVDPYDPDLLYESKPDGINSLPSQPTDGSETEITLKKRTGIQKTFAALKAISIGAQRGILFYLILHTAAGVFAKLFQLVVWNLSPYKVGDTLVFSLLVALFFLVAVYLVIHAIFALLIRWKIVDWSLDYSSRKAVQKYAFSPIYWNAAMVASLGVFVFFGASEGFRDLKNFKEKQGLCAPYSSESIIPGDCIVKIGSRGIASIEGGQNEGLILNFNPYNDSRVIQFALNTDIPAGWYQVESFSPAYKFSTWVYNWSPIGILERSIGHLIERA